MDRLSRRMEAKGRTVATLDELLGGLDDRGRRDAGIQRLAGSVEAVW